MTRQMVRHGSAEADAAKIARVEEVAREWQRLVRWQVHQLRSPERIADAHSSYSMVKAFRASPDRERFSALNSHLQQEAITHACAIVAGGWEQAASKVRTRVAKRLKAGLISESEAHELNWLPRWPAHLAAALSGGVVVPSDPQTGKPVKAFLENDHARLDRWLRGALLRARPRQPKIKEAPWFNADAMTYRAALRPGEHFPAWISLPTLKKGRPVRIPLAGDHIGHLAEGKTLKISVEGDAKGRKRIALRFAIKTEVEVREGTIVAGADKGITTVLTVTESDDRAATSHGTTYGPVLTKVADSLVRKNRSRLHAHARSTEATDARKAARIRKHNLDLTKRERARRRAEARLRQLHNQAIKEALITHPEVSTLVVEDLTFVQQSDRGSRQNRRLARWAKGQLRRDLERLSEANGVGLTVVNAAYSSQSCPVCWWTERANRQTTSFRCRACDYAGSSDAVAASNLRSRGNDPEITRYMDKASVKRVLDQRHQRWLMAQAADRVEARDLPVSDHGATPGMTTVRHQAESPARIHV